MDLRIAFFGTPEYSLIILEKLYQAGYPVVCVVTKPPRPIGRKQIMTPTPVATWAEKNHVPVLTPPSRATKPWVFADGEKLTKEILRFTPDLLVSADYTQKIPMQLVHKVKYGGLNVHPSLLPSYRGPAPVPWALLNGETETGVSLVTLTNEFDAGQIIAQEKELILNTDTTASLLTRLFQRGTELLLKVILNYCHAELVSASKTLEIPKRVRDDKVNLPSSYYPRLTRETGFESWEKIKTAMETGEEAVRIEQKFRALHPWPGLWTKIKLTANSQQPTAEKRLKILKLHLDAKRLTLNASLVLDQIQLEGKEPVDGTSISQLLHQLSN